MSYFDDASLVMIPSGYKTSKVYSVKPTDGTGDLTFTRSNDTATRVASSGLIEKVRTNRVLYSELQTNGVYSANASIASVTAASNPLTGQNDAFKITSTTGDDPYFLQNVSGLSNGENTFSCWAWTDAGQSTQATLFFYNQTATEVYTKAITLTTTPTRYDHTVSFSNIGSIATVRIDLRQTGPTIQYLYTYGWQAESGVATDYIATTSAAVSVGPVANVPRLDYLNSTCPRLLLEPQRSNLITYSEQIDNAAWVKSNASVTANQTTSPSGYVDADKLVENSSSSFHDTNQQSIAYTAAAYTISVFAKAAGRNHIFLQIFDGVTFYTSGTFNLSNGTVSGSGSIVSYGNGWYRCSFTATTAIGSGGAYINLSNGTTGNYAGDGTSGVFLYGAQVELGAYATSYIPTLGASVTRSSDVCNKTSVASLIGQTEGTLFAEVSFDDIGAGGGSAYFYFTDGSFANAVIVGREPASPNSKFFFYIQASGVVILNNTANNITSGVVKMALAYKSGDWAAYLNGNLVASGSTTFTFNASMSRIGIGTNDGAITVVGTSTRAAQALLFKTRLSNADLAALTA